MDINALIIMKITKYILAAIGTFALAACNKDTVHLDTKSIPTKVVESDTYDLYLVSDGLVHFDELASPLFFSVIKRDGSVVKSDSLFYNQGGWLNSWNCFQNNSDEFFCFFGDLKYPQPYVSLAKFDKDYHLTYFHDYDIEGGCAKAALDNGNFAFFSKDYSEADDGVRVAMRIINNEGELEDYMVYLEDNVGDGFFDLSDIPDYNFFSYGNKLIVTYSNLGVGTNYRIYNIDGTFVNSGVLDGEGRGDKIIRYSSGNLYLMDNGWAVETNLPFSVSKIDADGNQIFAVTLHAESLSKNVLVKDGVLVVSATCFLNGDDESKTVNRFYLIDDNSGTVKDSIDFDYDGSLNVELILPAYDGCYDVFTSRSKDDKSNAIHIFHTDDLHNLQSLNQ